MWLLVGENVFKKSKLKDGKQNNEEKQHCMIWPVKSKMTYLFEWLITAPVSEAIG